MNNKERINPFQQAAKTRRRIGKDLQLKTPDSWLVSAKVASCLLGVPKENFKGHLSISFHLKPEENQVFIAIGDQKTTALIALRRWQEAKDPQLTTAFKVKQYRQLYLLFQAAWQAEGKKLAKGIPGIFLTLLEEQEPKLSGLKDFISQAGSLPEDDLTLIQEKMREIWDSIPSQIRESKLSGLNPENIFQR